MSIYTQSTSIDNDTAQIPLANGRGVALVDRADEELVSRYSWFVLSRPKNATNYARGNTPGTHNRKTVLMHRLIMNAPKGLDVDHINRNGLDNRRKNLRLATRSENAANSAIRKSNSTGYKGVSYRRDNGKWRACVHTNGANVYAGPFDSPEEAARARDECAKKLFGRFAALNFPDDASSGAGK